MTCDGNVTVTDVQRLGEQLRDRYFLTTRARPLLQFFWTGATKTVRVEKPAYRAARQSLKEIFRNSENYYVKRAAGKELGYHPMYIELKLGSYPD